MQPKQKNTKPDHGSYPVPCCIVPCVGGVTLWHLWCLCASSVYSVLCGVLCVVCIRSYTYVYTYYLVYLLSKQKQEAYSLFMYMIMTFPISTALLPVHYCTCMRIAGAIGFLFCLLCAMYIPGFAACFCFSFSSFVVRSSVAKHKAASSCNSSIQHLACS